MLEYGHIPAFQRCLYFFRILTLSPRKKTLREENIKLFFSKGEVEQIAMMKPKGQTEHDEGMLEYLEDLIGSARLKDPIQTLCRRIEILNEQRGEKVSLRKFCLNYK